MSNQAFKVSGNHIIDMFILSEFFIHLGLEMMVGYVDV